MDLSTDAKRLQALLDGHTLISHQGRYAPYTAKIVDGDLEVIDCEGDYTNILFNIPAGEFEGNITWELVVPEKKIPTLEEVFASHSVTVTHPGRSPFLINRPYLHGERALILLIHEKITEKVPGYDIELQS